MKPGRIVSLTGIGMIAGLVFFSPAAAAQSQNARASNQSGTAEGFRPADSDPSKAAEPRNQEQSLADHIARVFNLEGDVKILRADRETWQPLAAEEIIHAGDQVRTGTDAFIEIYYDDYYQNIARIGAETIAEFRSIEPTDIFLSDGSIFNDLDGLPLGSTYEVATPSSVAGVRGTSFLRAFDATTSVDTTLVLNGAVTLLPVVDENGNLDTNRRVIVHKNQAMVLDQTAQTSPNRLQAKPLSEEQHNRIREIAGASQNHLTAFVGGEENIHRAREMWNQFEGDREKVFAVYREMRLADFERKENSLEPADTGEHTSEAVHPRRIPRPSAKADVNETLSREFERKIKPPQPAEFDPNTTREQKTAPAHKETPSTLAANTPDPAVIADRLESRRRHQIEQIIEDRTTPSPGFCDRHPNARVCRGNSH